MKADWKDPGKAPLGVRLMVCSFDDVFGIETVWTSQRVEGSVWVHDSKKLCDRPYGWDYLPRAITMKEVREHRVQELKDKS